MPGFFKTFGTKQVKVSRGGADSESEPTALEAHVQATKAYFAVDAPVYEGDLIEVPDPRGGTSQGEFEGQA